MNLLRTFFLVGFFAAFSAGIASAENPNATDGDKAAQAGTRLYNSMNPDKQLPVAKGDVVKDTMSNMGAGQSAKDAFSNAAKSNSGLK